MTDRRPLLVVLTGPIASGKSTVAALLSSALVDAGLFVATVDVDDVAAMMQAPHGLNGWHWDQAHVAHGALIAGWLRSSVEVVIAHGPIYTRAETDALESALPVGTAMLRVLLNTELDVALRRVEDDPERGVSRDPDFLAATYARFAAVLPAMDPVDLSFDTTTTPADQIVAAIAAEVAIRTQPSA